jgi:hypothetical protein
MNFCDLAKPVMWWSFAYILYALFMAGGAVLLPGNSSGQFSKSRAALKDSWRKVCAGTWQSPFFALAQPVLWAGLLPVAYPLVAFAASTTLFGIGLWSPC